MTNPSPKPKSFTDTEGTADFPAPEQCRSCRSPIRWGVDANTRKPIPLDAEPSLHGNVSLYVDAVGGSHVVVLNKSRAAAMRAAGQPLFLSHFVSCPQADRWRKDGRR